MILREDMRRRDCLGTSLRGWISALVTTVALLTTTSSSFADETSASASPSATQSAKPREDATIMVTFALIGTGLLTSLAGVGMFIANDNADKKACATCPKSSPVAPTVVTAVGGALFLTGATIFTVTLVRDTRRAPASASLQIGPLNGSLRVQF